MSVQVAKRCFSVDEYYRMMGAGILTEDDRVELIEGEIVEMSPIGSRHAACVKRLITFFTRQTGQTMLLSVQDPVRLDDYSEPEPDIALLRMRKDYYETRHPTPSDVLLVVEVADTSVDYDRLIKMPLYAKAGIPEAWLVDLNKELVEVYAQPAGDGYEMSQQARRGEAIISLTIPGLTIAVNEILG